MRQEISPSVTDERQRQAVLDYSREMHLNLGECGHLVKVGMFVNDILLNYEMENALYSPLPVRKLLISIFEESNRCHEISKEHKLCEQDQHHRRSVSTIREHWSIETIKGVHVIFARLRKTDALDLKKTR